METCSVSVCWQGALQTGGVNVVLTVFCFRKEMRNCFNQILIAINVCDSTHLVFAILEAIRTSFVQLYPAQLLKIFPYVHYPFYRYAYATQYIHLIFHHIEYCIQNLLDSLHLPDNKCGNREILCSLQTSSLQVPSESEREEVLSRLYYNAIPLKWKKVKVRGV